MKKKNLKILPVFCMIKGKRYNLSFFIQENREKENQTLIAIGDYP